MEIDITRSEIDVAVSRHVTIPSLSSLITRQYWPGALENSS